MACLQSVGRVYFSLLVRLDALSCSLLVHPWWNILCLVVDRFVISQYPLLLFSSPDWRLIVVLNCALDGTWSDLLWFVCRSIADYHRISERQIEDGSAKVRISSHVVLDRTKEFAGLPLETLLK